ncbi:MAG: DEAD/DEAH box helicase [Ilumatobacter fluminis]|uniref:DEAD/DEAH box helicase n=1 Tax=Ilumatobacter fluminis TaxID=467091 RepID=UPI0032EB6360
MSRDRAPYVAQGTWRSGALHVWGWNGDSAASAAWLYGGFGRSQWSGRGEQGWHDTPISYGELGRIQLELGDAGQKGVPAVRLDPFGAAVWLSETPSGDQLSASLAWFARLTQFAVRTVAARRLVPEVLDEGPFTVARWRPVLTDAQQEALDHAAASAPPICRNGSSATTFDIFAALVDGLSRSVLHHAGWKPDLGRKRSLEVQAARGVFAALAKPDPVIRSGSDEFERAVAETSGVLDRHRRRLGGEPVVRGRVRLTIPDDAHDPWVIDLELVDDADPGRWCTVADLRAEAARALDLAGGSVARLGALHEEAERLVTAVAAAVPMLEQVAEADHDGHVELDIEEADEFIEQAPLQLEQANVELIGPEHLIRAKVSVKGTASEGPTDDRRGRFGKEALVEWQAVIDETPISAADLERAEAAGVSLLRTGHRWVRIDTAALRKARKTLSEQVEEKSSISALELLRLLSGAEGDDEMPIELELADELGLAAEGGADDDDAADASWLHELVAGLPDDRLEETSEADGFVGELRHYQRRALSWMQFLARTGLGGCLADDMGLGKTATTLAHLLERPGPHLVVCPLSVVHNWEAEAHRFTPGHTVIVHHGSDRHQGEPALFGLADADIVITTYGLLPRDLEALAEIDWTTVVLDEAQMIKNPATKAAKAVRKLRAAQKLALTGTPVENRLSELWAILDACNPGLLGSQQRFREEFATAIERNNSEEAAARLRQLTQPFVLRRTKADKRLLPDLPDKIEQIAYAQLTKEQATLYQGVVDQLLVDAKDLEGMQRRGRVLAALTRLKQICNHPAHALKDGSRLAGRSGKLNRFDELTTELLDVDERALVFTQFREMGDLLQVHLQSRFEIDAPFLHGGVSKNRRDRMVAEFQEGLGAPLLIVSLKAGGTGLNLTAASQVIHYDRWWNPAVEDQATDRAWRMGQQRTVNVHKLVCQGTVEERIGQVIDEKRAIADAVIGSGEAWLSELSTDELADLVTLEVPR